MTKPTHRYDSLLEDVTAADLKKTIVVWGGSYKLSKDECIDYLCTAFAEPECVDAALIRMHPHERAAIGLVKLLGGAADIEQLALAVRATGTVPAHERYIKRNNDDPLLRSLIERGIVMAYTRYRYSTWPSDNNSAQVFVDCRILDKVQPLEHVPLVPEPSAFPRCWCVPAAI